MKVLLLAATELEIKPLLEKIEAFQPQLDVLIAGIGAPPFMYALTKKLQEQKYDLVLNVGIAGAFSSELPVGSIHRVVRDEFADLGIETSKGIRSVFAAGFSDANAFPFQDGKLMNSYGRELFPDLPEATAISVNLTHTSEASCLLFREQFKADLESMEGAAFFYVCAQEEVKAVQIRAVSNYVREREKAEWNIPLAVSKLNDYLFDKLQDIVTRSEKME